MTVDALMAALDCGELRVSLHDDELRCGTASGVVSPALRAAVERHHDALIAWCEHADATLDNALEDEYRRAVTRARLQALEVTA